MVPPLQLFLGGSASKPVMQWRGLQSGFTIWFCFFLRIAACLFLDLIFGKSVFPPLFLLVHAVCTRGWILSIVSGICLFLTFASEKRVLDR